MNIPVNPTQIQAQTIRTNPSEAPKLAPSQQPDAITIYLDLEAEARSARDITALRQVFVNSTRRLADYDQAFLLEPAGRHGNWMISAASSVSNIDRDGGLARAIEGVINNPKRLAHKTNAEARVDHFPKDAADWNIDFSECDFGYGLWLPLKDREGTPQAGLLALKQENWRPQSVTMLTSLAGPYAHAWTALQPKNVLRTKTLWRLAAQKKVLLGVSLGLIGAGFIPVPLTALAPAEIVAAHPNVVAAPIDGVIKDILVPPGAQVAEGTPLVTFVDTKLHNDAEVSARAKSVAEAKYFKALQSAISTQKEVQDLSIAKSELAVAEAELTYAQNMLSHAEIRAPKAGLVIYSAKSDWIGKPVAVGERVIDIADTSQVEIKIDLPVSDAIALQEGGPVKLFLDGDPLHPVEAVIDRVAYRPSTTPDHQLILRSFGRFKEGTTPLRIGLRGTARLTGEKVSLAFYLFRRPFALLRQKVGI